MSTFPFRVKSRILEIPFSLPATGPTNEEEFEAFDKFKSALEDGTFSSAIGWLVSLRQEFLKTGKKYVKEKQAILRQELGNKIRNSNGWAACLFFLKQVRVDRLLLMHLNEWPNRNLVL